MHFHPRHYFMISLSVGAKGEGEKERERETLFKHGNQFSSRAGILGGPVSLKLRYRHFKIFQNYIIEVGR